MGPGSTGKTLRIVKKHSYAPGFVEKIVYLCCIFNYQAKSYQRKPVIQTTYRCNLLSILSKKKNFLPN